MGYKSRLRRQIEKNPAAWQDTNRWGQVRYNDSAVRVWRPSVRVWRPSKNSARSFVPHTYGTCYRDFIHFILRRLAQRSQQAPVGNADVGLGEDSG